MGQAQPRVSQDAAAPENKQESVPGERNISEQECSKVQESEARSGKLIKTETGWFRVRQMSEMNKGPEAEWGQNQRWRREIYKP